MAGEHYMAPKPGSDEPHCIQCGASESAIVTNRATVCPCAYTLGHFAHVGENPPPNCPKTVTSTKTAIICRTTKCRTTIGHVEEDRGEYTFVAGGMRVRGRTHVECAACGRIHQFRPSKKGLDDLLRR